MAKSEKVQIPTIVVGGITIKRWWRSREVWNAILGAVVSFVSAMILLAASIAPEVLPLLHSLGLSPLGLVIATIALNALIHGGALILKMQSTSVIGTKADVETAKSVDDNA